MVAYPVAGEVAPAAVGELGVDALVFLGFRDFDLFGVEAVFAFSAWISLVDGFKWAEMNITKRGAFPPLSD